MSKKKKKEDDINKVESIKPLVKSKEKDIKNTNNQDDVKIRN
jgi:hypothetical protein